MIEKLIENSCMAWKVWFKYAWLCVSKKYEIKLDKAWNNLLENNLSKLTEDKKINVLNNAISKIEIMLTKLDSQSTWAKVINYLKYLIQSSL